MTMAYIEVDSVTTQYGKGDKAFVALKDVSLSIEKGEFVCFIGPSGCGKTTLLNSIAGFEKVTSGKITIDGKPVVKPQIQNITIFQNYGLLPWRTVEKNVEFGLEKLGTPKDRRKEIARQYIAQVGLAGFEERYPHQLSGGQQQRVAIARALAVDPDVLYMDEPFGALDAITRMKLQDDVLRLSREEKKTILFVTHDIEEAVFLADRIVVLEPNPGTIKSIVTVQLPHQRTRTSDDFILARDKVYDLLHMKAQEQTIEYYI
jgi:NitT/TauT family transport system ATP-binding protein